MMVKECTRCNKLKPIVAKNLCTSCYHAKYQEDNPFKIRQYNLKRYYKQIINCPSVDEINKQRCCSLCGSIPDKTLHLDHDHTTNVYRGMLCSNCNQGLGMFKDSIELLQKAINYLESSKVLR